MTSNPETLFKLRVQRDLKTLRRIWFFKSQEVSVRGIPDIIACLGSYFVALELKRSSSEKADPLQNYNLNCIERAGGLAVVVSPESWGKVFRELQLLDVEDDDNKSGGTVN